ncbi:hypothetical protein [Persicobacter diffluens]|uniref:Uncharacterized protein n=1 Tax=Persicobacter diffluens TaxID=981 RepID=A0AAN4VY62_9BACT|nr:hypothetical protein PEDI_19660 [Persicobacter diffluens]
MNVFDYCYFRICQFYINNKDKEPEYSGILILSLLQVFIVYDFFFFLKILFGEKFISLFSEDLLEYWILPVIILFPVKNYFRYIRSDMFKSVGKNLLKNESVRDRKRNNLKLFILVLVIAFSSIVCGLLFKVLLEMYGVI